MPDEPARPLIEGIDYTIEDGLYVFTAAYLLRRGYCCKNGCRNCPYGFRRPPGTLVDDTERSE